MGRLTYKEVSMAVRRRESGMSDAASLILRSALGGLIAGHGAQKAFGAFDGPGPEGTAGFMEMLGLTPGKPWAQLSIASELGGGALTALGLLNPMGPLGVIGAMAMATATAHRDKPIWVTSGGAELPVVNMVAMLALILSGPDRYSLDRLLGIKLPGWITPVGLVGILATVAYATSQGSTPPEGGDQDESREELAGDPDTES